MQHFLDLLANNGITFFTAFIEGIIVYVIIGDFYK